MTQRPGADRPPRWAERLLRFFLKPRDRETVAGDLLEEYREGVLPTRGRARAQLWYLRQVLSLVDGVVLGAVLGAVFGAANLVFTLIAPLAEDTPLALAVFYGPMFTFWGVAGFAAYRRTHRLTQAVKAGVIVAAATFVVFDVAAMVRVNLFLDAISQRSDWRYLVSSYEASGFSSLRAYANHVYLTGAPFKMLVSVTIGAASGWIGGLFGAVIRPRDRPLPG